MPASRTAQPRPLQCRPRRPADLVLNEVSYEHARWEEGLYLDEAGAIRADGEGIFSPGEIQPKLTEIECMSCGHSWHPRRRFAGREPR